LYRINHCNYFTASFIASEFVGTTDSMFGSHHHFECIRFGGTLNYQFQLNGGPLQGNNSYPVSSGTFTVSVTDGNNCTASSVLNITSPTAVGISTSFTPVSCFGGQSTLTVNGSGGTSPYFYGINNGPLQSEIHFRSALVAIR
jgi:hypothetical protein